MKFNIIYENTLSDIKKSEELLCENIMKKFGSALAAGTIAATSLLTPISAAASSTNVENQVELKTNKQNTTELIEYATYLLKYFEGSITDSNGNHIVYDDANNKHRWDEKQDINKFIKSCKGKATIGYGETSIDIVKKGKISDTEATQLLQKQIISLNDKLINKFGKAYLNLNIMQKSALISFYYNLGFYFKAPKMEANLKAGKLKEAADEFLDCNNITVNGVKQKSEGLTKRRNMERDLFIHNL